MSYGEKDVLNASDKFYVASTDWAASDQFLWIILMRKLTVCAARNTMPSGYRLQKHRDEAKSEAYKVRKTLKTVV